MCLNFKSLVVASFSLLFLCACESEVAKKQRLEKERTDPELISSKLSTNLTSLYGGIKAYKNVFGKYSDISKMSDVKVLVISQNHFILDENHKCFEIIIKDDILIKAINEDNLICSLAAKKSQDILNITSGFKK